MAMTHEEKKARRRELYSENAEKIKQQKREAWAARPKKERVKYSRNRNIKTAYGITQDEYEKMLKAQNGVCAICGGLSYIKNRPLMVDHDHKTDKVRDLLCSHCNLILGHCKDAKVILERAIDYLDKHRYFPPEGYDDERNFPDWEAVE